MVIIIFSEEEKKKSESFHLIAVVEMNNPYLSVTFDAQCRMVHMSGYGTLKERGYRERWNRRHTSFINLELDGAHRCRGNIRIGREKLVRTYI